MVDTPGDAERIDIIEESKRRFLLADWRSHAVTLLRYAIRKGSWEVVIAAESLLAQEPDGFVQWHWKAQNAIGDIADALVWSDLEIMRKEFKRWQRANSLEQEDDPGLLSEDIDRWFYDSGGDPEPRYLTPSAGAFLLASGCGRYIDAADLEVCDSNYDTILTLVEGASLEMLRQVIIGENNEKDS